MLMGNANGTTPPTAHTDSAFEIAGIKAHVKAGLPKREFVQIEYEDHKKGPRKDITDAHFPYNSQKNRYTNILPCDETRVKLKQVDGVDGSDYINANFIEGEHGVSKAYIATQGPLMQTRQDFWRMVWENNSSVIVMLGKEEENRRIKVDRYWPEVGEEILNLSPIKIQSLSKHFDTNGSVNVRKLQVTHDVYPKEKRTVMHYQYEGWQDHGVPKTAGPIRHLVKMIEEDRKKIEKVPSPMVVHCSAGVGRTGTFCTVHMAIQRLHMAANQRRISAQTSTDSSLHNHNNNNNNSTHPSPRGGSLHSISSNGTTNGDGETLKFDLYSTVRKLRNQRPGMVQQMEQYLFCYEAIAEEAEELGLIPPEVASEISSSTVLQPPSPRSFPPSPRAISSPNMPAITTSSQLSQQQFGNHTALPSSSPTSYSTPPPPLVAASSSSHTSFNSSYTNNSGHYSGSFGGYNARSNPLGQSSAHLPPPNPLLVSSANILPPSYSHSHHYSPSLHLHLGSSNNSTTSNTNILAQSTASLGSSTSSLSSSSSSFSVPLAAVSPSSD
eukprot:TRINITY_DN3271_c0_g1_i1.p1 TRINITY_DN3271_c0_g1~~TRINITY_DN3271_c0_g1_i1.p1  ORF type:complete len:553 (+),score=93.08 TRINITY_DN3271_c0_g1_i1:96-1754(+)